METLSGETFSLNENDWRFMFQDVPLILKQLHDEGFKIVIFTNQMGIEKQKITPEAFCRKMLNFST